MRTILFFTALQTVTGLISWDTGCGVTKGCFPDCPGGCEYLVTWQQSGSTIAFTMQVEETDNDAYLALAFSEDLRMGDDSVIGCIPASGTVISAFNDDTHTETLSPTNLGLSATSVSQANGVITCSFTRDITNADSKFFNLNDDYILMLVVGEAEGTSLGHHYVIPWNSDGEVDFNSFEIVDLYKLNSPPVKLHGIMMILAWMLFSVIGILTARYNKDMLHEKTLFGSKLWFQVKEYRVTFHFDQVHRGCMVAVLVFVLIGFIPIFVELEGYSQIVPPKGQSYLQLHPIIGIIVTIFTFANPIAAFFRPKNDHKYRWIFNWGHMILGISNQVLAVIAMIFGYILERSKLPDSAIYVNVAMIVVVVLAAIILEVHKWKNNTERSSSVDSNGPDDKDGVPDNMEIEGKPKPRQPFINVSVDLSRHNPSKIVSVDDHVTKVPFYTLLVVGLVVCGLTMGILGIIAAS